MSLEPGIRFCIHGILDDIEAVFWDASFQVRFSPARAFRGEPSRGRCLFPRFDKGRASRPPLSQRLHSKAEALRAARKRALDFDSASILRARTRGLWTSDRERRQAWQSRSLRSSIECAKDRKVSQGGPKPSTIASRSGSAVGAIARALHRPTLPSCPSLLPFPLALPSCPSLLPFPLVLPSRRHRPTKGSFPALVPVAKKADKALSVGDPQGRFAHRLASRAKGTHRLALAPPIAQKNSAKMAQKSHSHRQASIDRDNIEDLFSKRPEAGEGGSRVAISGRVIGSRYRGTKKSTARLIERR